MTKLVGQVQQMRRRAKARSLKRRALERHDIEAASQLTMMVTHGEVLAEDVGMSHQEAMRFPFAAIKRTA